MNTNIMNTQIFYLIFIVILKIITKSTRNLIAIALKSEKSDTYWKSDDFRAIKKMIKEIILEMDQRKSNITGSSKNIQYWRKKQVDSAKINSHFG